MRWVSGYPGKSYDITGTIEELVVLSHHEWHSSESYVPVR